ncbi:LOW QUALITY PROTEIN: olfactory receptor 8S1-like [Budorcas taxicolor]|uniref:LOW QUALITY PROTEIN: olfactory receptor 8S1-like n=1 Tax=Budorcas taxicolor TaxID=37181 RepID=UPI002283D77C|nr:LOW QUALITY PROTEIN: olfactory receptor 8S1-like [Budorcas taxicolor]
MALGNHSTMMESILLGLSSDPHTQALLFVLFLLVYLLTLTGNMTMRWVIRADSHLHTPMYYFLSHLSFLDLCFSSVTVPKMLENLLSKRKTISVESCLAQAFFVFITAGTEALYSVMAYGRCVAICQPLLYGQEMSEQRYALLVWGSWSLGILNTLISAPLATKMGSCDTHIIPHYSCELPSLFLLSCSDASTNLIAMLWSLSPHGVVTSLSIFFSCACIVSTILSITSTSGRSKAFSMCSSRLTTVILFSGSGFLHYFTPMSGSSLELVFSVLYSIVIPMLNPLIYSLRNKEVKAALHRTLGKYLQCF